MEGMTLETQQNNMVEADEEVQVEELIKQMRGLARQIKVLNNKKKQEVSRDRNISRVGQGKWLNFKNKEWNKYKTSGGEIKYREYLKVLGNKWSMMTQDEKDNYNPETYNM